MSYSAQFAQPAGRPAHAQRSAACNDIDALLEFTRDAWTDDPEAEEAAALAHTRSEPATVVSRLLSRAQRMTSQRRSRPLP